MAKLPYENSKCNTGLAEGRIKKMLRKFGVTTIAFIENIETSIIEVRFTYNKYPIAIPIDHGKLAQKYIDNMVYEVSDAKIERTKLVAHSAAYSMLEDLLKGLVMAVELDALDFEDVFMAYVIDNKGIRLGQYMRPQLEEFRDGQLALGGGDNG